MTHQGSAIRHLVLAATALLALLALPGPVAADTCACDPIQPYLVVDRYDEVHVTYRNASNTGVIYASNKSGSWVKRRLTTSKDIPYAIAVDGGQRAYIVFRREVGDTVRFYMITNLTGEWVTSRLSIIPNDAYRIRLAVAPDRSLHLSFDRDEAVYCATNASGTWTRRRLDHAMGNHAILALDHQGHVHLLFEQCLNDGSGTCDGAGIYYQTNATGAWTTERVTDDQSDWGEDLLVDRDGVAHFVFSREDNSRTQPDLPLGVFYVTNLGGSWTTTRVAPPARMATIERSSTGVLNIFYTRVDTGRGIYRATDATGSWTRSTVISEYAMYPTTGVDHTGRLHLAFMRMAIDPGIYYSTHKTTGWSRFELLD